VTPPLVMTLIIDENVPEAVAEFFRARGHIVIAIRDFLGRGAPDDAVAEFGDVEMAVVVTWDRDFKRLVRRVPLGNRMRFRKLGRISFECRESAGLHRLERLIDHIEFSYSMAQRERDHRLILEVTETSFRVIR
jgi:predicted nuclease of predicted toxin-antitoxin system